MHLTPLAPIYSIFPLWRNIRKRARNSKIGLLRKNRARVICFVSGGLKDFDALAAKAIGPGRWVVCCFAVRNAASIRLSRQARSFKIPTNLCGFGSKRCGTSPTRSRESAQKDWAKLWAWAAIGRRGCGSINFAGRWCVLGGIACRVR